MRSVCAENEVLLHEPTGGKWLRYRGPVAVLAARSVADVSELVQEVQRRVEEEGLHAAGFLAYEAAPAFDPAFRVVPPPDDDFPLAWFGLYQAPRAHSGPASPVPCRPLSWTPSVNREEYGAAIRTIRDYIARGDTYQVNYTHRLRAPLALPPEDLFAAMTAAQGAHYGAFLSLPGWTICSASPEIFFRQCGPCVTCRPMKGTIARGLWPEEDRRQAARLRGSEKDRAENVMIVDMVRNDMGRIATTGSVRVTRLFDAERYPTLWQMTGTVRCRTSARPGDVLAALFPAASITGAPKVRTMQIIAELEPAPRRIYTGAIGFLAPGRRAQFSVAIRTVLVDERTRLAEYGVGGGVVWDSTDSGECEECATKARILTAPPLPAFDLLETILWRPGRGYVLLADHLGRLRRSAEYFGRPIDPKAVRRELERLARGLPHVPHRVRILLAPNGQPRAEAAVLTALPRPYRLGLAPTPVRPDLPLLYHKTTYRQPYDAARAGRPDCDDVLLWNERGEITESGIANVVVERQGQLLTPPLACGLLPGLKRQRLLASGKVKEAVIRPADLPGCTRILLVNSVRGVWQATWVSGDGAN